MVLPVQPPKNVTGSLSAGQPFFSARQTYSRQKKRIFSQAVLLTILMLHYKIIVYALHNANTEQTKKEVNGGL